MRDLFSKHLNNLLARLEENNIECAIVSNPSNIFYLTGFQGSATLLLCENTSSLYVPVLEYTRARKHVLRGIEVYAYSKYPLENVDFENYIQKDLISIIKDKTQNKKRIGIEESQISMGTYNKLREALGERDYVNISDYLTKLRSIKDELEVEIIKKAIEVSEKSYLKTINELTNGLSELEVAGILELNIRRNGGEGFAFPTITAFNENAAYPHAQPSNKKLEENSIVLIDWGARVNGYCSDMTRTLTYGTSIPKRILDNIEIVKNAQEEAIDKIEPGVKAAEVDARAREILKKAGLLKYFIHGLGHGVGIDVHESPYLSPGSNDILEPGMIVTVEPGVYFEGEYGIRIEDMILVTKSGRKVLTSVSKIIQI